ncbi:sigma-70 family RNA polymerase sigma factor [Nonomuraea dietziae]|uniref:sigma-70 family RNA polymerase sigma factor n=1 Tax=Nonomuraea dietziae TaxID=65515 RepID=UPI0034396401
MIQPVGPGEEFTRLADPYRELLKLCYRMVGSVHDAEDIVQATYLRAWRSYGTFAGRSSLRTWLYRIATNACLRAAEQASRRPLPSDLSGPANDPAAPAEPRWDMPWLQPFPARVPDEARDPAEVRADRATLRLARASSSGGAAANTAEICCSAAAECMAGSGRRRLPAIGGLLFQERAGPAWQPKRPAAPASDKFLKGTSLTSLPPKPGPILLAGRRRRRPAPGRGPRDP